MRLERGYSQEDMEYFDFRVRHWQQIEKAERRINGLTLLKVCEAFRVSLESLIQGLDDGIYDFLELPPPVLARVLARKKRREERLARIRGTS